MLIRGWLAQIEKDLNGLIPSRHPYCLVGSEAKKLILFSIIRPCNRKGSCWEISLAEETSHNTNIREIIKSIISTAIKYESKRAHSWIVRCNVCDVDRISALRELGFQPLKLFKTWSPPNSTDKDIRFISENTFNQGIEWESLNSHNAQSLYKLAKSSESSQIRLILDRQWQDLLQPNNSISGLLLDKSNHNSTAIMGIVESFDYRRHPTYELLRDTAWDSRISHYLPNILERISRKRYIIFKTNSEDVNTNKMLISNKWIQNQEEILLGRSLWKRKNARNLLPKAQSIDSVLERLQPQTPPLPTPTLGRR